MKYCLIIFLSFTCCLAVSAQPQWEKLKENTFNPSAFPAFKTGFSKKKYEEPIPVSVNNLIFLDRRTDTTKLGFILAPVNSFTDEFHQVVFPKPAAEYLTEKIKSFYSGNKKSTQSLTIVLRQLWVSERKVKTNSFGRSILLGPIDQLSYCHFGADYYITQQDQHQFLGSIDSVIAVSKMLVNAADDLLRKTMWDALNNAPLLLNNRDSNSSAISNAALQAKYRDSLSYPILKATGPAFGVYMTYAGFLNNSPSVPAFTIEKTKRYEALHSTEIPDSIIAKAWGYCDSTGLYVHINNNYYRAVKSQNTFELAGPGKITSLYSNGEKIFITAVRSFFSGLIAGGFSLAIMNGQNSMLKELVPFQLNIHDGTLY